jgi:hypothetical protein
MARSSSFVLDDDAPPAASAEGASRPGFEWGLAACLIGITFLIMGPIAMVFCVIFWDGGSGNHGLRLFELEMARIGVLVCAGGALILSFIGAIFGARGLKLARLAGQPTALPWAGIALCLAAIVMWLIVGIDLMAILSAFIRWKGPALAL